MARWPLSDPSSAGSRGRSHRQSARGGIIIPRRREPLATRTRTPLGSEETRAVLQRAAELDREHAAPTLPPSSGEPGLDDAELERIAAESGLSREALQRAIDELRGGALEPRERGTAGPSGVEGEATAQRTFAQPPAVIERRLSAALEESGLEPVRRGPHATRWEPAPGLHRALGRAIDWRGSSVWIGSTIESSVYAVPGDRCCARLRGDAKDLRLPLATLAAILLAFPFGISLLVTLAIGLRAGFGAQHAIAAALFAASWLVLSLLISRGISRRRIRKLQRSLERLLAQLGETAP